MDLASNFQSFVLFATIVLAIWTVPDGLKFCAFYFGGFSGMASPILYSFVNSQLKENYGERGRKSLRQSPEDC
jgi:ACS family pantothenate transporter-like MFS transporter